MLKSSFIIVTLLFAIVLASHNIDDNAHKHKHHKRSDTPLAVQHDQVKLHAAHEAHDQGKQHAAHHTHDHGKERAAKNHAGHILPDQTKDHAQHGSLPLPLAPHHSKRKHSARHHKHSRTSKSHPHAPKTKHHKKHHAAKAHGHAQGRKHH